MRTLRIPFLLAAVVTLSASAHAEIVNFTYTPTGGAAITFSLDTTQVYSYDTHQDVTFNNILLSNGDHTQMLFTNPTYYSDVGDGAVNFFLEDTDLGAPVFAGAQIYSGPESDPTFTVGDYTLLADLKVGSTITGTLDITAVLTAPPPPPPPVATTPEPSSLLLLATGLFGAATTARRRLAVLQTRR